MYPLAEIIKKAYEEFSGVTGIDPGENTGIYIIERPGHLHMTSKFTETLRFIEKLTDPNALVVCEDYLDYQGKRGGTAFNRAVPAQLIGALKLQQMKVGFKLKFQHANQGKLGCPDELLKQVFNVAGLTRHEKDALRHIVTYALSTVGNKVPKEVQ